MIRVFVLASLCLFSTVSGGIVAFPSSNKRVHVPSSTTETILNSSGLMAFMSKILHVPLRTDESSNIAKTVALPVSDMIHPPNTIVLKIQGIKNDDLENLPNMKSWLSSATKYTLQSGVNLQDSLVQEGFSSFSEFAGHRNASILEMNLLQEKKTMKQFDDSLPTLMDTLDSDLVLMVLESESTPSSHGKRSSERKLLATSEYKDRIALFYTDAQEYQLLLWTSIVLIFITYFVVAALFEMDYGVDDAGLYSRFKTDSGNDESKNQ